jgi:hypothetical protein
MGGSAALQAVQSQRIVATGTWFEPEQTFQPGDEPRQVSTFSSTLTTDLAADRFRLSAEGMDIHLWYSPGGDWLALETVRGGRILRYERDWTEEAPS